MENENNSIQAAIDAGQQLAAGKTIEINGVPFLITPANITAVRYEELNDAPQRIDRTVDTSTAESFVEYFNRFANDNSAIFLKDEKYTAIIDYHGEEKPAWCKHIVEYKPQPTTEWAKWKAATGRKFDQEDFAYFIEECADEIHNPPGAEMLEIATTLKAKTKISFSSAKRLDNGQTQLTYSEEIDGSAGAKGELRIPESVKIGMRLYKGGDAYEMHAKFRYRIREGSITFWFDILRPEKTVEAAIEDISQKIKAGVKCQLFIDGY